jgi:hypothetical protein
MGMRRRVLEEESHRLMDFGLGYKVIVLEEEVNFLINVADVVD